jgi:hypothetical protein
VCSGGGGKGGGPTVANGRVELIQGKRHNSSISKWIGTGVSTGVINRLRSIEWCMFCVCWITGRLSFNVVGFC